ncbi:hypothetical protein SAMN06298212_103128 [Ruaniaceae bacterium KH17]|nr:hypothetical protein SAMN06298212_103128 [Ruaniaceae bacterium KH17]
MHTAMITGGTSGLGAEFARQLAEKGLNLVIVARDESRLATTATQLRNEYGVQVETVSADLSDRADVARVSALFEQQPIEVFINNAGFGIHSPLTATDTAIHERAFDVMIRAVFLLGGAAARAMERRGSGTIINVSSVAGYIRMGSYSAVKAWVTAYTESLAVEMAGTGVTVTNLTPGWVHTEFHERAGISSGSIPAALWTTPANVVSTALRDASRGKLDSTPTASFKVLGLVCRYLPRRTNRWVSGKIAGDRRKHSAPIATEGNE